MAVLRRTLPAAVAMLVFTFVLAATLTSHPLLDAVGTALISTVVIVAAIALFLGLINVLQVHLRKIRERPSDRLFSLVLITAMLVVLIAGLPQFPNGFSGPSQPIVQWIFEYIQVPIQASLSGLLVFFVVTAAYRLLRVRNIESTLMLITALFVLVGQVTVGLVPVLPGIRDWILDVPAMAGVRGILLGVALGALLTGIRLLLGVERPYSD